MVSLEVVPASPFHFTARRVEGRIELLGYVSDERDRAVAASLAATRFPGERLVDRLLVAEGAPAGFGDAMRASLEILSDFAEGNAAIRDRELRYGGRVLYGQLAARIRRTAPKQVPEGWQASVELDPVPPPGALDSHLCADLLGDVARRNPVRFEPGKAAPAANAGPALEAAADVVRRCGRVGIRIVHHLGASGDQEAARDLAADRARALATALAERGATARFTVEGTTGPEKAEERIEFRIAPL
jgi:OOP family OmpA-OmpF porin